MAMNEAAKRRVRAGRLLQQGKEPAEVARLVGAPRQTVYRWREVLQAKGVDGLREMSKGGRPRAAQCRAVPGAARGSSEGRAKLRIRHRSMDAQTCAPNHREALRSSIQRGARLAAAGAVGLLLP